MDKNKKNARRISETDMAVLNGTFAENDDLLFTIRKAMFFMDLNPDDTSVLGVLAADDIMAVVRKIFMPVIRNDVPLQQNIDLWMTIEVKELDPWHTWIQVRGRQMFMKQLEAGLERLTNYARAPFLKVADYFVDENIGQSDSAGFQEAMAVLSARNTYISHVEACLSQIRTLAGRKDETPEETIERLKKDSAK